MKIEEKVFYLRVSEIKSLDDILSSSEKIEKHIGDSQSAAVVFSFKYEPDADEITRSRFALFLTGLSAVTVAESKDFSGFSLEFLTLFDKAVSEHECSINSKRISHDYGTDLMHRYELICGRKEAYNLKKFFSGSDGQSYRLPFVTVPDYEGSIEKKTDQFLNNLFNDKTAFEAVSIAACFVKARTEGTVSALNEESIRFYSLVNIKNGGCRDGKQQ